MRRWVRSDKGNILIMMSVAMAVLAGFGVLTIDIGRQLVTRSQLQNAADAGALAGAALYCEGTPTEAEVRDEVRLVGGANTALQRDAVEIDIPNEQITIFEDGETSAHEVTVETISFTQQFLTGLFTIFQASNPDLDVPQNPTRLAEVHAIATARCGTVCGAQCVKPWSPPDRWDDVTPIAGHLAWSGNNRWDSEFKASDHDLNGNGLWDAGEAYNDSNGNGQIDQEAYHPTLTGYGPDPIPGNYLSPDGDLGLEMVLHFDNGGAATAVSGQYQSIRLPPVGEGTPDTGADVYRENIERCNQSRVNPGDWLELETGGMVGPTNKGMDDLIKMDPDAYWDPTTQSIQDSDFAQSPRIVLIPIYDPRVPVLPGHQGTIQVVKLAAFFMERMEGPAEVRGRFIKARATGEPCTAGQVSFLFNLNLIR
jgi:hypothetical protein